MVQYPPVVTHTPIASATLHCPAGSWQNCPAAQGRPAMPPHCRGFVPQAPAYATETPVTGTCNGNSYYQTDLQSSYQTWRTSFHVQNNGVWVHYYASGYDTKVYPMNFTDNNSHSEVNLCVDNGVDWYCGWGTRYTHDSTWTPYYTHLMTGF